MEQRQEQKLFSPRLHAVCFLVLIVGCANEKVIILFFLHINMLEMTDNNDKWANFKLSDS